MYCCYKILTKKYRGNKSLSFPPPWTCQNPIPSLRASDTFLLLGDPGLLINLPRNWLSHLLLLPSIFPSKRVFSDVTNTLNWCHCNVPVSLPQWFPDPDSTKSHLLLLIHWHRGSCLCSSNFISLHFSQITTVFLFVERLWLIPFLGTLQILFLLFGKFVPRNFTFKLQFGCLWSSLMI